ncbi:hypothetical protein PPL_02761 [Heterostelium album PN500]|uniref:Polymorphic outer membrane protein n=1 Tax=Heterostelium pallidum (strain ATCC 26659 / Pp 5 / PN500) TaxID=670386 RepID=D3B2Z6_HETP5|nr:hypothetical protein PPL_02761 [Heterostelium album PN500]EFA83694.1 hypothetical protein PPL_02761 [Heterostelium album PN500]|eukprot:XP_020435811.1 hypothetical protein PPL_02761 [Heterostelium album PN500]
MKYSIISFAVIILFYLFCSDVTTNSVNATEIDVDYLSLEEIPLKYDRQVNSVFTCIVSPQNQPFTCANVTDNTGYCPTISQCLAFEAEIVKQNPNIVTTYVALPARKYTECLGIVKDFPQSNLHVFYSYLGVAEFTCNKQFLIIELTKQNTTIIFDNLVFNQVGKPNTQYGGILSILAPVEINALVKLENVHANGIRSLGAGGFIFLTYIDLHVTDCSFTGLEAQQGGVIRSFGDSNAVFISNSVFTNNKATQNAGVISAQNVVMSNCTFTGNSAQGLGGVLYTTLDINNIFIDSSTFTNNTNSGFGGGALYLMGPASISNSMFTGQRSTGYGGAVYSTASLEISSSQFTDNSGTFGGAIFSKQSLVIENSIITDNNGTSSGGAIASQGDLEILNSTINNNWAAQEGGAIYFYYQGDKSNSSCIVYNSYVHNNYAGTYGGAFYVYENMPIFLLNTTVFNNYAGIEAGGLYFSSQYPLKFVGGTFMNNSAGQIYTSQTFNVENIGRAINIVNVSIDIFTDGIEYHVPLVSDTVEHASAYDVSGVCDNGIATINSDGKVTECTSTKRHKQVITLNY